MTPEDALEKLTAGADLVQIYTGFIYEGPGFVKRILKAILAQ
jgi:dihydroorotate dehydrogenase